MSINENEMIPASDEDLFKQPPPEEDCPICFLRMPSLDSGHRYYTCCGKVICGGCVYANRLIDLNKQLCPFCRSLAPSSDEEIVGRMKKRIKAEDALAVYGLGCLYSDGLYGLPQNRTKAIEIWHRAGQMGYTDSYHNIGNAYLHGNGVQEDMKKANRYWELAAMGGDASARYKLGDYEEKVGNLDRALKHFMVAVEGGEKVAIEEIRKLFMDGHATKDDYAKALRAHQSYLNEIKSHQRDEAAACHEMYTYY